MQMIWLLKGRAGIRLFRDACCYPLKSKKKSKKLYYDLSDLLLHYFIKHNLILIDIGEKYYEAFRNFIFANYLSVNACQMRIGAGF
ncbi:MAG TPA: hypothetical protein DCE52_18755 [Rhodobacteraceae bacterium]|nr:hypothetical protein [Paracoccaceae bacterium]